MGSGGSSLPPSITGVTQMKNSMSAEYKCPSDYRDVTDSDLDVDWSPGDGVCPSTAQFNDCFQSKFDDWRYASSTHLEGSNTFPFYMNAFLNLLKQVPPFFQSPPKNVDIKGRSKSFLMQRSSVEIYAEQHAADELSGVATSRLFNWHRSYDVGIWLYDGTGDIESIRRLQNHPWIADPFFESQGDDPVEDPKHCEVNAESISHGGTTRSKSIDPLYHGLLRNIVISHKKKY